MKLSSIFLETFVDVSMARYKSRFLLIVFMGFLLLTIASCGTSKKTGRNVDYHILARAAIKLDFDIDEDDDWPLMIEASTWIGTPYKYGGEDRYGIDCSGLTRTIYRQVYKTELHRNSYEQYKKDVKKVSKNNLVSGDLVFFSAGKKGKVSHVGIYLKDGKFIHASSSRGVVVSDLNQNFYKNNFISGGKVK